MKPHIVLLFCSVFLICCNSHHKKTRKNDLVKMNLKGKVHSVIELTYMPTKAAPMGLYEKLVITYNELGYEVENIDSTLDYWSDNKSKYDQTGKLASTEYYNRNGTFDGKSLFKYDSVGNETERDLYDSSSKLYKRFLSSYDKNGTLIERKDVTPNDSITDRITYKYDKAGNNVETIVYTGTGILRSTSKSQYDDNDNQIENDFYGPQSSVAGQYSYKYDKFDEEGNWISRSEFDKGKALGITKRKIEYYP